MKRIRAWRVSIGTLAAALLLAGCGENAADESNPPASGGGGAGGAATITTSDIKGTWIDTYITEGGAIEQPADPSTRTIAALVLSADGSFAPAIEGSLSADGTFVIPSVPEGLVYIELKLTEHSVTEYIVTSERSLDLGYMLAGRPDKKSVMVSPTNMTFNVGGLKAWQDTDKFELFALGSRTIASSYFVWNGSPMPKAGDTALTSMIVNAATTLSPGRIEGSKGDLLYLTQLVGYDLGDAVYESLEKVFTPPPFDVIDGVPATLSGSFEDVPQEPLKVTWDRESFLSRADDVHPEAVAKDVIFTINAEPGGTSRFIGHTPRVMRLTTDQNIDILTADVTYGNPFPASWDLVVRVNFSTKYIFALPNDPMVRSLPGYFVTAVPLGDDKEIALSADLTPPLDLRINGLPATQDLAGVGTSPKIEWKPPAVGSPARYTVEVFYIDPAVAGVAWPCSFTTTETSIVVPPGILKEGSYYAIRVMAESGAGSTITAPNKSDYGSRASALSSPFSI